MIIHSCEHKENTSVIQVQILPSQELLAQFCTHEGFIHSHCIPISVKLALIPLFDFCEKCPNQRYTNAKSTTLGSGKSNRWLGRER